MAMLNNQRVTWVNDPKLRHWLQRSALRQYQPVVFLNPTWSPSQLTALPRSGELGWSGITWSRIPGKDRFTIFIYIYIYIFTLMLMMGVMRMILTVFLFILFLFFWWWWWCLTSSHCTPAPPKISRMPGVDRMPATSMPVDQWIKAS